MSVALRTKGSKKHFRCVICGLGFTSTYDETLKAYPVYHPAEPKHPDCEHNFFSTLLRIYTYIHQKGASVTTNSIVSDMRWIEPVQYRKDLIGWCINVSYFSVDSFNRLSVPDSVVNTCGDMFESDELEDPETRANAVDMLIAALRCLQKKLMDEARPDAESLELLNNIRQMARQEPSRPVDLPKPIGVDEDSPKRGMFTADSTLADRLGSRGSSRFAKAR